MKRCPVYNCDSKLADSQAMCSAHWEQVSEELRAEVRKHKDAKDSDGWIIAVKVAAEEISMQLKMQEADDYYIRWWNGN